MHVSLPPMKRFTHSADRVNTSHNKPSPFQPNSYYSYSVLTILFGRIRIHYSTYYSMQTKCQYNILYSPKTIRAITGIKWQDVTQRLWCFWCNFLDIVDDALAAAHSCQPTQGKWTTPTTDITFSLCLNSPFFHSYPCQDHDHKRPCQWNMDSAFCRLHALPTTKLTVSSTGVHPVSHTGWTPDWSSSHDKHWTLVSWCFCNVLHPRSIWRPSSLFNNVLPVSPRFSGLPARVVKVRVNGLLWCYAILHS